MQAGDTIDFVVDINANLNSDQYLWAPELILKTAPTEAEAAGTWSAARDFPKELTPPGPLLTAWEQLAQLLLISNELMFVD